MKKYFFLTLTGLAILYGFASCSKNDIAKNKNLEDLELEIDFLKFKLDWIDKDLERRFEDYVELADTVYSLEEQNDSKSSACFSLSDGLDSTFQPIESSSGSFLVSIKEITPYLSGYRITFSIGNPSLATYDNSKLKVRWNRSYKSWKNDKKYTDKMKKYEEAQQKYLEKLRSKNFDSNALSLKRPERPKRPFWSEEKKEKEFTLLKSLNPGSWNTVEVHITPATLDQLGWLEVSIETTTVSLIRDQRVK